MNFERLEIPFETASVGLDQYEKSLHDVAKSKMKDDPAHDIQHIRRVVKNAKAIAAAKDSPSFSFKELIAATWLHDIVSVEKNSDARKHAGSDAADLAVDLIEQTGLSRELNLSCVHEAIRCHNFSANLRPDCNEGLILQDADRLDAIGAIGVARCFSVGARIGAKFHHEEDPFARARNLDDGTYSVDHFYKKLLHLCDRMNTPEAKRLARKRTDYMTSFLRQLENEISGVT